MSQVLERFLKYTRYNVKSDENTRKHPSTPGQLVFGQMLVSEMRSIWLKNVRITQEGYVFGELPPTPGCEKAPALGLIAHIDTSDAESGKNIKPQVIEKYDGNPVPLGNSGRTLGPAMFPVLKRKIGETLVVTDGTTLLGGDDHAGLAAILTAAEELLKSGEPHGKLCFAFTPDEEIGEGTMFFDVPSFGADYAYTLDGGEVSAIEYQNFNAASAEFVFHGVSAHPGSAKGTMKNALLYAIHFQEQLPSEEIPEKTQDFQGFFHLHAMEGNVSRAVLRYLVREHDDARFEERKQLLHTIADSINRDFGAGTCEVHLRDQYRNMEKLIPPFLIDCAKEALSEQGLTPVIKPIRGGTDGAMLSFKGLPCPNLGAGAYNMHSVYEFVSVNEMEQSVKLIRSLIRRFSEFSRTKDLKSLAQVLH